MVISSLLNSILSWTFYGRTVAPATGNREITVYLVTFLSFATLFLIAIDVGPFDTRSNGVGCFLAVVKHFDQANHDKDDVRAPHRSFSDLLRSAQWN